MLCAVVLRQPDFTDCVINCVVSGFNRIDYALDSCGNHNLLRNQNGFGNFTDDVAAFDFVSGF